MEPPHHHHLQHQYHHLQHQNHHHFMQHQNHQEYQHHRQLFHMPPEFRDRDHLPPHQHSFQPPPPPHRLPPPSIEPFSFPYRDPPIDHNSHIPRFFSPPQTRVSVSPPSPPPRFRAQPPPPPPLPSYARNDYQPAFDFEYTRGRLHHHIGNYADRSRHDSNFKGDFSIDEHRFQNSNVHVIDDDRKNRFLSVGDRYINGSPSNESLLRGNSPNMRCHETYNYRNTLSKWPLHLSHHVGVERYESSRSLQRFPSDRYGSRGSWGNDRVGDSTNPIQKSKKKFIHRSVKRKPIKKKSALLRIQLGNMGDSTNSRNKSNDFSCDSKDYCHEGSGVSETLRGQENDSYDISDHMIEEMVEPSSVELDLSFKSNSLVAKAIATPSTQSRSPSINLTDGVSESGRMKTGKDLFNPNTFTERNNPLSCVGKSTNIGNTSGPSLQNTMDNVEMVRSAAPPLSRKVKASGSDGNSDSTSSSQRIKRKRKIIAAPTHESFERSVQQPDILSKSEVDSFQVEESKHLEPDDVFSDVVSKNYSIKSPLNNVSIDIEFRSLEGMILETGEANIGFSRPYISCHGKTGDSAVSSISAGTIYSDSSAFCNQVETITEEVPVQGCRSNDKYDSTILPLERRHVPCSFEKLFDSSEHSSQSEFVSHENLHTGSSPEVEVSVRGYTEFSQPGTKKMKSPMHHACQPADINECLNTCDLGCTVTCPDPKCDRKDEDITNDYAIFSSAGCTEAIVRLTTLLSENKPCENVPDVCGSRDTNTACKEIGHVSSSYSLCNKIIECNKSISVSQDDFESDRPLKIVDQLEAPIQKGVGREFAETISSVDSLEVYPVTSVRKRKSSVEDLPRTTGSCVGIETARNCCLNNACCTKESVNLDKNNGTSLVANLAGDPVGISFPDQLDDANKGSPRHGKKSKINQGNNTCDSSVASLDESAFANIPSLPVSSGSLIQDITSGASFKAGANNNGSFKECQEIDLLSSHPCVNPEDSPAVSKTKNQLCHTTIVSDGNVEALTNMVGLTDGSVHVAINSKSMSPCSPGFRTMASTSNSVDEVMNTSPNDQSPSCPPNFPVLEMDNCTTSESHLSSGMVHQNDKTPNIETLPAIDFEGDKIVDQAAGASPQISCNMNGFTLPQGTDKVNPSMDSVWIKSKSGGDRHVTVVPRVYASVPLRSNIASRRAGSLSHIAGPRTWRRTSNISSSTITDPVTHSIVPQQSYTQKIVAGVHNSYVRKGNSLVRKSSPICTTSKDVPASTVNCVSSYMDNLEKVMELDPKECHTKTDTSSSTGGHTTTLRRHKLPSTCYASEMLSSSAITSNGDAFSPGLDPPDNVARVTSLNPLYLTANMDNVNSKNSVKPSGGLICQTGSMQKFEGKGIIGEKDCAQEIMYVKHKRNQLVAAMGIGGATVPCGRKKRMSSSNEYYKKRKNQLVRTLPENHVVKCIAATNASPNEGSERVKLSGNGKGNLLSSSVWRFNKKSSKPDANSVCSFRGWYHVPWKRATYLRHFKSTPNGYSLSKLSQKRLSRSKATVYTRSTDGFSLRRSKVLGVGSSNLKWSKSSERKLKKANEEVTLPVAGAVKSKNEGEVDPSAVLNTRNNLSRERIFRIGSHRYKMDPTKKTLHRITHEDDQLQLAPWGDDNGRKSYVPRKLFFGNDDYVRIGNGNQLIRDPKKRTRSLASEKVRWSLHKARLRLAKKKKYCQFFTRFGQCNKDDGKCSYIHDPSKIAVCTKFLSGSCSNQNCNLTHEVIPERMPDCSYFLLGLCSNKSCPYRHVHVNPSSSVCEEFLRGYCASGNECRKKHTYVCPMFEATGECPQGSKCKLHHPKKRNQMKKPLRKQKKAHGRYFVPGHIETSECTISKMLSERCNDDILHEDGRIADFISLTVNEEEVGGTVGLINKQASDLEPPEAQVSDLEDLIKPIRLMSKIIRTPAVEL